MLNYISATRALEVFIKGYGNKKLLFKHVVLSQILVTGLGYYSIVGSAPSHSILYTEIPTVLVIVIFGNLFSFISFVEKNNISFPDFIFIVSPALLFQSFLAYFIILNAMAVLLGYLHKVSVMEWEIINSIFVIIIYLQFYVRLYILSYRKA